MNRNRYKTYISYLVVVVSILIPYGNSSLSKDGFLLVDEIEELPKLIERIDLASDNEKNMSRKFIGIAEQAVGRKQ